eukprot:scaffold304503_cov24-Prasinocladus_malaysianus.AAC.1
MTFSPDCIQLLPGDVEGGRAGGAAALLGNVLEMSPQGLQSSDREAVGHACKAISVLVAQIPLSGFLQSSARSSVSQLLSAGSPLPKVPGKAFAKEQRNMTTLIVTLLRCMTISSLSMRVAPQRDDTDVLDDDLDDNKPSTSGRAIVPSGQPWEGALPAP